MCWKKKCAVIICMMSVLIPTQVVFSVQLIRGDKQAAAGQTFSFPVGKTALDSAGDIFYVTAYPGGATLSGEFAVAKLLNGEDTFRSLAPESVTLDGLSDQANPLFNNGIKHFALLEGEQSEEHYPIVVTSDHPDQVYALWDDERSQIVSVASMENILGADLLSPFTQIDSIAAGSGNLVFCAGGIGSVNGGIAVLHVSAEKKGQELEFSLSQGSTVSLNRTSQSVTIGSDLEAIEVSDMYWDHYLDRLYICLRVVSGFNVSDGAKALIVGKIEQGRLIWESIAPDSVFAGNNEIVGSVGPDQQVSLHKIRTMFSVNRLSYAIVVGGNGDLNNTKRSVFALPLVNDPLDNDTHGKLANKNALPMDELFSKSKKIKKGCRYLKGAATTNDDILTASDAAAMVGGGDLAAGDIDDIFVSGDTVYATVGEPSGDYASGVFMSQALFDEYGKIKRWTHWKRAANAPNAGENVFGAVLETKSGNFLLVSGDSSDTVKIVTHTQLGQGDENGIKDLLDVLNQNFPEESGSLHGLFEYAHGMSSLKNIALLVASGFNKVALVEMGQVASGVLTRNTGDFSTGQQHFYSGGLEGFSAGASKIIMIEGGIVDDIGSINSSTIAFFDSGRLFLGGAGGLCVLVDENGNGWDTTTGLGPNFAGLTSGMSFKKVGDFSSVRKIMSQGNFLYVLTDNALYRLDLVSSDFVTGNIDSTQLASLNQIPGLRKKETLLDFVVSKKLCVLATRRGLFRSGDGQDISNDHDIQWTEVTMPAYSGKGLIIQLLAMSQNLVEQDVATEDLDGMVCVLRKYKGSKRPWFNRFAIASGDVGDTTLLSLPDYLLTVPTMQEDPCWFFRKPGSFKVEKFLGGSLMPIPSGLTLKLVKKKESKAIKILRSVTGPVFVAGDQGLSVVE